MDAIVVASGRIGFWCPSNNESEHEARNIDGTIIIDEVEVPAL